MRRLFALLSFGAVVGAPIPLTVNTITVAAFAPAHLLSLGWEMHWMLSELSNMTADARFSRIASHLSPAVIRVGGISADWIRYKLDNVSYPPWDGPGTPTWFTAPMNMSLKTFYELDSLLFNADLSLMFDLSELYNRTCNVTQPGAPNNHEWCTGEWDTSNVAAFLARLHEDGAVGGTHSLFAFELGNELETHLTPDTNVDDVHALSSLLTTLWAPAPRPPLIAPSASDCGAATAQIMDGIVGVADGFSFHVYPAGGAPDGLEPLLLNSSWLRTRPMESARTCLDAWDAGPRAAGTTLWVTETSASWSWAVPDGAAQNSFLHGFYTLAHAGQWAQRGLSALARWSLSEPNPFALIAFNGTQWDVASDFWLMITYKALVGTATLAVTGDDAPGSNVLAYASCTLMGVTVRTDRSSSHDGSAVQDTWRWDVSRVRHPAAGQHPSFSPITVESTTRGNGTVTLIAINPSDAPIDIELNGGIAATTPRIEYVFTAPGDNVGSLAPLLNGGTIPLRLAPDGTLPNMPGRYISAGGAAILSLPPRSQAFFVLLAAGASVCS
jgi:Glycosyl hydrolase family 79, N-terminal domain